MSPLRVDMTEVREGLHLIPPHMHEAVLRWIEDGELPGDFLQAVLCNDLRAAVGYADDINRAMLPNWVMYLHNHAPGACWGSPERVAEWADRFDGVEVKA